MNYTDDSFSVKMKDEIRKLLIKLAVFVVAVLLIMLFLHSPARAAEAPVPIKSTAEADALVSHKIKAISLAMITSAGSYRNIFTAVALMGMLAAGIMGLRGVMSGRGNMLVVAFVNPLLGCMLFLSVMIPKENIYIYEPSFKRYNGDWKRSY